MTDYIIRSRGITGRNMFFDYTDQLNSFEDTLQLFISLTKRYDNDILGIIPSLIPDISCQDRRSKQLHKKCIYPISYKIAKRANSMK
jgi:hypothetical protein